MTKGKLKYRLDYLIHSLKILIRGLILAEGCVALIKLLFYLGLKYRGYKAVGGEFLLMPLLILIYIVIRDLKDLYREVK